MKTVIIIIPVYREYLTDEELLNVRNNVKRLSLYEICFICPQSLHTEFYEREFPRIKCIRFPDAYFKGIKGYNKLMLSKETYKRFETYDFLCVCQADALILKEGRCLDPFQDMDYDYIGAPWFPAQYITLLPDTTKVQKFINLFFSKKYVSVGNGGLSLRRINRTYWLLDKWRLQVMLWPHYEDYFFAFMGRYKEPLYKIAPVEIAQNFSVETGSRELIGTKNIDPVGIHGYRTYYPEIVSRRIP